MEKPKHRSVMFSAETRIRLVPMQIQLRQERHIRADPIAHALQEITLGIEVTVRDHRAVQVQQHRIHGHGAALICQLSHMGRRTRWDAGDWITPVSPVGVAAE